MKFPSYWTRVSNKSGTISAKGWSDTSQCEADENAKQRLQRIINALNHTECLDRYPYVADHVICEEVIDRVYDHTNEVAVISRNAYGSLIMNTPIMLFADIDIEPPRRSGSGPFQLIRSLFSKLSSASAEVVQTQDDEEGIHIDRLYRWQAQNSQFSLRVYRTFAGLRVVISNHVFKRVDEAAIAILQQWGSDRRFEQLCKTQQCFRARLTPKPWRVGMPPAPTKFPFKTVEQEREFASWFDHYIERCGHYRVCELVTLIGQGEIVEPLRPLIEQHDALCNSQQNLPLA